MIRVARAAGWYRPGSVRRALLTSCAVLAAAGIMLLAAPITGSSPARAQFGFGGFHISIGGGGRGWRRSRHSRSPRRHKRRNDDDTPDPDTGGASSTTPASTPASEPARAAVRPASSTQPDPRPSSSGRPAPRGPDLEPSK